MPMKGKLSPKHLRFVTEYLKDQNAKASAIRAGYSKDSAEVNGPRLLRNAQIRAEIDRVLKKAEDNSGVTKEWVISGLKEVAERCLQRVPVMVRDPDDGRKMVQKTDEETGQGVWEFDSSGANKAFELIGRHLAMFTDKVVLSDTLEKLLASTQPPVTK